jgi:hypothetical protein
VFVLLGLIFIGLFPAGIGATAINADDFTPSLTQILTHARFQKDVCRMCVRKMCVECVSINHTGCSPQWRPLLPDPAQ